METTDSSATPTPKSRTRHRNNGKKKRSDRREGAIEGKSAAVVGNSDVENGRQSEAAVLPTWREFFANHKPLLMVMDHHTLRIARTNRAWMFKCTSCDLCVKNLEEVNVHIQKAKHVSRLWTNWSQYALAKFCPSPAVLDKLNEFLEAEVLSSACTKAALRQRELAYTKISSRIRQVWPKVVINMVGSAYHGMGLLDCDLNLSLYAQNDSPVASPIAALSALAETKKSEFQDFERHFSDEKKPPFMSFKWEGKLPCTILILDDHSHRLAKLMKEYGQIDDRCWKLCVLFRKWAYSCCIDGQSEGCWPSHAVYLMVIYFLQQLPEPVLPVLHELIRTSKGTMEVYENVSELVRADWKSTNTSNLATLWIQLLKFYSLEFDSASDIVCITQKERKTRSSAGTAWSGKRIAIMDPYAPDKNVTRTVSNSTVYDFMMHCLRTTCLYFSIPQTEEGPIFGTVRPPLSDNKYLNIPGYSDFLESQVRLSHFIVKLIPLMDVNYVSDTQTDRMTIVEKISALKGLYVNTCQINLDDFNNIKSRCQPRSLKYVDYCLFLDDAYYLMSRINPKKLHYRFTYSVFSGGEEHPRCCIICAKNGHTQSACPELMMDKLIAIPPIDKELTTIIDRVCMSVYDESKPSPEDVDTKEKTLSYLQEYIQALFPSSCLTLFGSSVNGFGVKNSDMDICMTFANCPTSAAVPPYALTNLFKHLKKCRDLRKLIHIQNAKVPIVKFLHVPSQLEGDISLYNILAQENTKLLRTYSEIDKRVKILGYMVKRFARVCNVGDASKGSLSSYCYILMMVYFLQNCNPPVLPVLQTLPKQAEPLPKKIVDGCDTYFYDNISKLGEVWPGYQKNSKSSGELWIEFLRFYTEEFDTENYVVSIRTEEPVLKLEKRWFTKVFAIEDPFAHTHNLGSGLTRKMNLYIIKAFRSARLLFTSKIKTNGNNSLVNAYFNQKVLSKTEPPNDRGCKICKSIGHKAKSCPQRFSSQSRSENEEPPKRDKKESPKKYAGKEQLPPNERFVEANRLLLAHQPQQVVNPGPSQSRPIANPGPSQPYYPPVPALVGRNQMYPSFTLNYPSSYDRYNPLASHSNSRAQMENHQMILNSLMNKSKATGKTIHKKMT